MPQDPTRLVCKGKFTSTPKKQTRKTNTSGHEKKTVLTRESKPDQKNNANKVPSWFFRYVGTKTFAFSSKN